ncbi:hypothetical protein [Pseudomonas songnenensis]|uniref:Uncharacterized protein n=1 Tax=Pseudomonas songnenensis TaxID=1176259 RepID=A0A482U3J0_9PSED|nr:hypothetical protein [Pseudomonas songnenensis]RYJ61809.1 hypothetical protein EJA06_014010 [Pseudomonas songnenensis]
MSEGSTEKTKRKMTSPLKRYDWYFQYSIFYDNPAESVHLNEDLARFRIRLKRFKDQPFLIVKRLLKRPGIPLQAYATIFTTKKINNLDEIIDSSFCCRCNSMSRAIKDTRLISTIKNIDKQRLHDLGAFFGASSIKRYSIVNKACLIGRKSKLFPDNDIG